MSTEQQEKLKLAKIIDLAKKKRELLTQAEASEFMRVKTSTLAKWRMLGKGPSFVKLGHKVFYRAKDLDRWIDQNVVTHIEG